MRGVVASARRLGDGYDGAMVKSRRWIDLNGGVREVPMSYDQSWNRKTDNHVGTWEASNLGTGSRTQTDLLVVGGNLKPAPADKEK